MKFIRFGVLSPQKQITYGDKDYYHAAPCKKGIYAFPKNYVEKFLLGATNNPNNSSSKTYWIKDENGNKIPEVESDWNTKTGKITYKENFRKLLKKQKIKTSNVSSIEDKDSVFYMVAYKKPHRFKYDGDIWHHHYEVLHMQPMVGDWVKTDIETYKTALKLTRHIQKREILTNHDYDEITMKKDGLKLYSKDHLEVFIEKLK